MPEDVQLYFKILGKPLLDHYRSLLVFAHIFNGERSAYSAYIAQLHNIIYACPTSSDEQ